MDILSIIGVVLGLIAIIGGAILKGSSAGALVGSAAFVIVLVGGGEPEAIRSSMEIELDTMEHFDTQAAKVFEAMGVYSPTLGIIGAVMGLMAVMQNL